MKHELPELGYAYDALEPYIDARTMEIHHKKHHQAYVDNLNKALEGHDDLQKKSPEDLLMNLERVPEDIRQAVINHGGGHFNHSFFWKHLKKDAEFSGSAAEAIKEEFGSFEDFREKFSKAAASRFGSGWAWLVVDKKGKLKIMSTVNQDSPVSEGMHPVLSLDVWEHAYYLKYQNKRPDYIKAFFSVIDWSKVEENYRDALDAIKIRNG